MDYGLSINLTSTEYDLDIKTFSTENLSSQIEFLSTEDRSKLKEDTSINDINVNISELSTDTTENYQNLNKNSTEFFRFLPPLNGK